MPLWGTNSAVAADKPKFLSVDINAKKNMRKTECTGVVGEGWVITPGGNGNVSADKEVLVCARSVH